MAGVVQSSQIFDIIAVVTSACIFGAIHSFHIFSSWVFYMSTVSPQAVSSILREWRYRGEILSTDMAWLGASQVFLQGFSAVG